jgi:hypothetical protein
MLDLEVTVLLSSSSSGFRGTGLMGLNSSELQFRVVEMIVPLAIVVRAQFVLPFHDPQLWLISRLQEHLLLQGNRSIDSVNPMLRDCPDIEKLFERQERENPFKKLLCLKDTLTCGVRCIHDDRVKVKGE